MENTFVKFYYGSDAQIYLDNWEEQYKGGIFFDTQNKQIYYNGEPYGKGITDSDLSDITTALSNLNAAFVSVSKYNESAKDGYPASLVIEFTDFGGDISENVKIPIMSVEAYDKDITCGLISKEDWNKLESIDLSKLVYTDNSRLLTEEQQNLLNNGDIVNKINTIKVNNAALEIDTSTKSVNIDLDDAINKVVSDIVSSVYTYQGSLVSMEALRNITNPTKGHVYNLSFSSEEYGATGVNVAWDGEKWDSLGGIFSTADISGDIQDLQGQISAVETNLGTTNTNVSNLSKIVELMNSDASTDLDGDENLTNEQKYSISYKINTEIQNVLTWTEIN